MYQMYGKFHTIDNRVGNRIEVLENEQLVVGAWRDSFWMQHEALSSFSGIFVLLGVLYLLPINKEYLPVILLITYLEGNIVSLSQKIGRIDFWDVQIKDLNTLEAEWGQPYEYIGTEDVPEKMSLQHIKKSYLGRNFELTQTETLYIEQGDIIRIWGESGNGKSTLLGIICGAFKVCYSLIRCDNSYWYSEGFRSFKKGQILEFPQNMGRMTSKECFRNLASTYVDSPTDNELTKVLTIVCLIDWWNNENFDFDRPLPGKPSGGQQSRLAIAAALTMLIRSPVKIVLFDEITGDLDPVTSKTVWRNILSELKKNNTTVFISSHGDVDGITKNWKIVNGLISIY